MICRVCLILFLIACNIACVSTVDIKVDDEVNFYHLEMDLPVADSDTNRVRIRASGTSADYEQSLDADETIRTEGATISGPIELGGDLDVEYYSLAYGWDKRASLTEPGSQATSFYLGLATTRTDLDVDNPNDELSFSESTIELYSQFGFRHLISKKFDIGLAWAFSFGPNLSGFSEVDLMLTYELTRQLRFMGGYRWYRYETEEINDDSNLEIDFQGPVLGFELSL